MSKSQDKAAGSQDNPVPPATGEEPAPQPQPKAKKPLTPAQLEARRKGGKARGEQLKNDPAHQSRAAKIGHQSQGRKEKLAAQARKNLAKALEHYPDLYERAGEAALRGMAAKKERLERLERERLAQEQAGQEQHGEQSGQSHQRGQEGGNQHER